MRFNLLTAWLLSRLRRTGRNTLAFAVASALLLAADLPSGAQTTTGTIRGTITDAAGAGITEAQISARNVQTGVTRGTVTRADGSYVLAGLVPATYGLTLRRSG